jgi:hypothetical protein
LAVDEITALEIDADTSQAFFQNRWRAAKVRLSSWSSRSRVLKIQGVN